MAPLICQKCQKDVNPGDEVLFIDDDGNDVDVENMRIVVGGLYTVHANCPEVS